MNLCVGQRVLAHCPGLGRFKIRAVVTGLTGGAVRLSLPYDVQLTLGCRPDGSFTDRLRHTIYLDEDDPSQPDIVWIGPQS